MIDYTAIMIARLEYEQKIRSLAPVLDYDDWMKDDQPRRVSRQVGRWLSALGCGLSSLGEQLKHGQDSVLEAPLTGHERGSVPS